MAKRAHRIVATRLLKRIVAGEFPAGGALIKEQPITEEQAVNRGTVREALRALEERHVVLVRHGRGAAVQEPSTWNVLDPMVARALLESPERDRFLQEIEAARVLVEGELAARAAMHASESDHEALEAAVGAGTFDATLGRVADNRPLATVAAGLRHLASEPPEDELHGDAAARTRDHGGSASAREAVARAIAGGDADAARAAMQRVVGASAGD